MDGVRKPNGICSKRSLFYVNIRNKYLTTTLTTLLRKHLRIEGLARHILNRQIQ
jgi:hypothetical protein